MKYFIDYDGLHMPYKRINVFKIHIPSLLIAFRESNEKFIF